MEFINKTGFCAKFTIFSSVFIARNKNPINAELNIVFEKRKKMNAETVTNAVRLLQVAIYKTSA